MEQIIRKADLFSKIKLSDTTIWRMEKRGQFPPRRRIGPNRVAWLKSEIEDWMADRPLVDSEKFTDRQVSLGGINE